MLVAGKIGQFLYVGWRRLGNLVAALIALAAIGAIVPHLLAAPIGIVLAGIVIALGLYHIATENWHAWRLIMVVAIFGIGWGENLDPGQEWSVMQGTIIIALLVLFARRSYLGLPLHGPENGPITAKQ